MNSPGIHAGKPTRLPALIGSEFLAKAPQQTWLQDAKPGVGIALHLEKPGSMLGEAVRFWVGARSTSKLPIQTRHHLSRTFSKYNRQLRHFGLTLAFFAMAGMIIAQEPTQGNHEPTIKVQVEQVLVPAIVTDRKGHFITDLKVGDFRVFEDGVEQKLAAFYTEENSAPELFESGGVPEVRVGGSVALSPSNSNSLPRHTYLIALDTLNSSFGNFAHVRDALQKLFKEEQGSNSQYALIALGQPTRVLQNLTRDPEVVLAALGNKDLIEAIKSSETSNMAQQESELTHKLEDFCRHCPDFCGGARSGRGKDASIVCSSTWDPIVMWANAAAEEREQAARGFVKDLRGLTEQLSRMPGRRVMILASDGFNFQPGRELFRIIAAYTNHSEVLLNNHTDDLQGEFMVIANLANVRNVAFYTLDSRGLYAMSTSGFDATQDVLIRDVPQIQGAKQTSAFENQDAMNYLAAVTGGVFYRNSNDILKGLRQSFADGRQYYVLAYNSSNQASDGKYRTIEVRVKGKDLMVRAKSGYIESAGNIATAAATARAELLTSAAPAPPGNIPTNPVRAHAEPQSLALFDREALRRARTACVDTSYLPEGEASDIKKFLAKESEPGKLLKSLTWELTDQCATADAVIRVYFAQTTRLTEMRDLPGRLPSGGSLDVPATQVVLLVYDRASVRLLYRTEVQDLRPNRVLLLKVTFARLARDLRRLGP